MVIRLLLNHSQICQAFSKVQTIAESRALWDDTLQIVAVPCWPCWPRRPRARRTTCLLRWSPGWTSMGWPGALRSPSDPGCISFLISVISVISGMWWSLWRSKRCMGVGSVSKSQSVSAGQNRLNVCDSWVRKTRTLWDWHVKCYLLPDACPRILLCFKCHMSFLLKSEPIPVDSGKVCMRWLPFGGLSRWSHGGSQSMQRAFVRRTATIVADCSRIIVQLWVIWLSSSNLGYIIAQYYKQTMYNPNYPVRIQLWWIF